MRFTAYEVIPLRDFGEHTEECSEAEADFWGLFGVIDDDPNAPMLAIGDFSSQADANLIKEALEAS